LVGFFSQKKIRRFISTFYKNLNPILDKSDKRYKISRRKCNVCGNTIGYDAVNIARNEWKEKIKRLKENRIPISKKESKYWYLNCLNCSAKYEISYRTGGKYFKQL